MNDRKPENPPLFTSRNVTLRDLFAAAALAGFLGSAETSGGFDDFAEDAYKQADAMLAEREGRS